MKIKLLASVAGFFLIFSFALAQDDLGVSAGLTPKSPFYFLDTFSDWLNLKLTFNSIKKVEKKLEQASERLAELKALKDDGNLDQENAEKLKEKYKNLSEGAEADAKDLKTKGKDITALVKKMEDLTARHTAVLQKVLEKVPEQAKDSIEKALEVSKRGHEQAIEAIQKEVKEGKIKREELREEIKGEIEEEVEIEGEEIEREKEGVEELKESDFEKEQKEIEETTRELEKNGLNDIDEDLNELEELEKSAR